MTTTTAAAAAVTTSGFNTGCFYSDGTPASDWAYASCGQRNTSFRTCCLPNEGDLCMANGLCAYPAHYLYRGPCDNRAGDGCRSICPEVNPNTWVEVQLCPGTADYCCSPGRNAGRPGDCCGDGTRRFALPDPVGTTTASASASTSASSSAPTVGGGGGGGGGAPAGAIAGGVVGGVAGAGVLGAGAWWALRRLRRRRSGGAAAGTAPADDDETKSRRGVYAPVEMDGQASRVESDSRAVQQYEMQG